VVCVCVCVCVYVWDRFFDMGSLELFARSWLWTTIHLISASWIARITGMSHQRQANAFEPDDFYIFVTLLLKYPSSLNVIVASLRIWKNRFRTSLLICNLIFSNKQQKIRGGKSQDHNLTS
jgi:hypothetical protein